MTFLIVCLVAGLFALLAWALHDLGCDIRRNDPTWVDADAEVRP